MSEPPILAERSAFFGELAPAGPAPASVTARQLTGLRLAVVSARPAAEAAFAARVRDTFGVELAPGPRRSGAGPVVVCGLAPRRWLMIAESRDLYSIEALKQAMEGVASVVDQSGGLAVLRLSGRRVRNVLEKGVSIDLDPRVFGADSVAATSVAHVGVTLWRSGGDGGYDIAVSRSYVGSFCRWLVHSAAEYGLGVEAAGPWSPV